MSRVRWDGAGGGWGGRCVRDKQRPHLVHPEQNFLWWFVLVNFSVPLSCWRIFVTAKDRNPLNGGLAKRTTYSFTEQVLFVYLLRATYLETQTFIKCEVSKPGTQ